MKKLPKVYEVDLRIAQQYGIKLASFEEYFSGEQEKESLRRSLGAVN
jgi:hypothetical protein